VACTLKTLCGIKHFVKKLCMVSELAGVPTTFPVGKGDRREVLDHANGDDQGHP
jgi:hypothetical protein